MIFDRLFFHWLEIRNDSAFSSLAQPKISNIRYFASRFGCQTQTVFRFPSSAAIQPLRLDPIRACSSVITTDLVYFGVTLSPPGTPRKWIHDGDSSCGWTDNRCSGPMPILFARCCR
ncbi:hypothetical protein RvY_13001 [Ramazzottius varieornatus]|uniref:Uncharacterized protein n=1 Tax=Ramazzottius varieornatus TaxID=947166 RepID=A0A1D1VTY6_RAMVA|nr:hypothetical protein RvY_13001 [Ramazzottius varieornatus]